MGRTIYFNFLQSRQCQNHAKFTSNLMSHSAGMLPVAPRKYIYIPCICIMKGLSLILCFLYSGIGMVQRTVGTASTGEQHLMSLFKTYWYNYKHTVETRGNMLIANICLYREKLTHRKNNTGIK